MSNLDEALCSWRSVVGEEHVRTDPATLRQVETATFATDRQVPAVIYPADRDEVQRCVLIANTYRVPIYPISTGKNWGYGSRVPARSGCVVMSLERLNRIVDFSEELAYITIEPGVTFLDVNRFLAERRSTLKVNLTGSTYESSLIGNAMERGLGTGVYGDRAAHVCDFEVVLPTGELLRTGFGRFGGAAAGVNSWGVGPSLDGLFTQSNLGIVTRMTVWLMPASPHRHSLYFTTGRGAALNDGERTGGFVGLIDALRRLRFLRICDEPVRMYNDYRALSGTIQFPYGDQGPRFLSPGTMAGIRRALGIGAWCGELHIDAHSEAEARAQQQLVYDALHSVVDTLYFVDSQGAQWSVANDYEGAGDPPDGSMALKLVRRTAVEQARQLETPGGIRNTYWRKKTPVPERMDPDRDGCGVLWCAPAVPFTGHHVARAVRCMESTILAAEFEPNISLILLSERCAIVNAALLYDRETPGDDERAMSCYGTLLQRLLSIGYVPYRLGAQSMDSLPPPVDDYSAVLQRLKAALDPNGILAPGRYEGSITTP